MKYLIMNFCLFLNVDNIFSQTNTDIKFKSPLYFFAAAGPSLRTSEFKEVTISPIDQTVKFDEINNLTTRVSFGMYWIPCPIGRKDNDKISKFVEKVKTNSDYKEERDGFALSLLVNIFQLNTTTFNTSPIDVGFGVGYKTKNLLVLITAEFTPMRTPRDYFFKKFENNDTKLILNGKKEPESSINITDDNIFKSEVKPFLGIKIGYAFSN